MTGIEILMSSVVFAPLIASGAAVKPRPPDTGRPRAPRTKRYGANVPI
jgi:hypothetical protein